MNKKIIKIKNLLLKLFIPSECETCRWKEQCKIYRNEEKQENIKNSARKPKIENKLN